MCFKRKFVKGKHKIYVDIWCFEEEKRKTEVNFKRLAKLRR